MTPNSKLKPIVSKPIHPIENVTLENIRIDCLGGGTEKDARREVPEHAEKNPGERMFGTLPAYGFFCRHVKNLEFHNVELSFQHDDRRPAMIFDDVAGLELLNVDAQTIAKAPAVMWLKGVEGAMIHGSRPRVTAGPLLRVDGRRSRDISVMNNDFAHVKRVLQIGEDVSKDAVYFGPNRTGAASE